MADARRRTVVAVVVAAMLLLAGGLLWRWRERAEAPGPTTTAAAAGDARGRTLAPAAPRGGGGAVAAAVSDVDPLPGQGRAVVEAAPDLPGGAFRGRVINWSTGAGVAGAELTIGGPGGEVFTLLSDSTGAFEMAPPKPGGFALVAVEASGFLPYAPEWQHSSVRLTTSAGQRVRGLTVFLFPALDYTAVVVDAAGQPLPGASARILGSAAGEQALTGPARAWSADAKGEFVFNAPDFTVIEAEHRGRVGRGVLDGAVQLTRKMTIVVGAGPGADASIAGKVVGDDGVGLAGVLVRATPDVRPGPGGDDETRATSFAMSDAQGRFRIVDLDAGAYDVTATADERAPVTVDGVASGAKDVRIEMPVGVELVGKVVDASGSPVPAFTLLVMVKPGIVRMLVTATSIVDGGGAFRVRVPDGSYELIATASGLAPSPPTPATPGRAVTVTLPAGSTVHGRVVSGRDDLPVPYARIMLEAPGGGASATPANAGTVTREDGTFELTGIPPGPVSLTIGAGGHHPKIESMFVGKDGAAIGPLRIALTPLADGEAPRLELVGIGVKLAADGDLLRVDGLIPGGGAADAGVVVGDRIAAVEGRPVPELGMDGAIALIRGAPGTRVKIALVRESGTLVLDIERKAIRS